MFGILKSRKKNPIEISEQAISVLNDYYTERLRVIEPSMQRHDPEAEFYQLVKIEKDFLEVLNAPDLLKLKILYVLHDRLQSINKVKNNIADVQASPDERNDYIVADYNKRLNTLRAQTEILQTALHKFTA